MMLDLDGEELVSAAEVATRLGLKRSRQVLDLRLHRFGFPRPVARTGRNLVWSWPQVANWAETEGFGGPGPARPMGGGVSLHSAGGIHGGTL
jgi:predicted DNA-binding transcriptional regulator AlpA